MDTRLSHIDSISISDAAALTWNCLSLSFNRLNTSEILTGAIESRLSSLKVEIFSAVLLRSAKLLHFLTSCSYSSPFFSH